MLMLPYVRFFGIECRKDTLLSTAAIIISMFICCGAIVSRSAANNVLTRKDLVDTITLVVRENQKLSTDLAAHVDGIVQRQANQEERLNKVLDQSELNQVRLQEIANAVLKAKHITITPGPPKVNE